METAYLFVLFLLFRSALSLPVSQNIKSSVKSTDNVAVELTERTVVFHPDTIRRVKDIEQVKSLDSVSDDTGLSRNKRETIKGNHSCAQGMKWILNNCVTLEKYKASKDDDDYEITALPVDEGTTLQFRTTKRALPTSQPEPTPPQTTSRLELTSHSITTLRPELTPQNLTTARPEPTPHSLTNNSSKQDHISSSLLYLVAVILVPYQIWCHYHTTC